MDYSGLCETRSIQGYDRAHSNYVGHIIDTRLGEIYLIEYGKEYSLLMPSFQFPAGTQGQFAQALIYLIQKTKEYYLVMPFILISRRYSKPI